MEETRSDPSPGTSATTTLSKWEPSDSVIEITIDYPHALRLGAAAKHEDVKETPREKLQAETLSPIVKFFIWANSVIGFGIFTLAIIEMLLPVGHANIITDKVIIALIGGLTVQVGAVIIAAFKGLFAVKG